MPAWFGTLGAAVVEATWQGIVLLALVEAVVRVVGGALPRLRHAVAAGAVLLLAAGFLAAAVHVTVSTVAISGMPVPPAPTEGVAVEPALLPWLGAAWCVTVLVAGIRLLSGLAGVGRLVDAGVAVSDPRVRAAFRDAVRRVRPGGPVRLREVPGLPGPAAAGWRRPTVLVPGGFGRGLADEHVVAILTHELTHVAHRDYAVGVVVQAARMLVWFHPSATWLARRAEEAREEARDDEAARLTAPLVYARALERLERSRGPSQNRLIAAVSPTETRILRLVAPSAVRRLRVATVIVLVAGVAAAAAAASSARHEGYGRMLADRAAPLVDIEARDPAGAFTLVLRGGRALGATVDGSRLPPGSVLQRGDRVTLLDRDGLPAVSVRLTKDGTGIRWDARPAR